jgi:hypothetical protein
VRRRSEKSNGRNFSPVYISRCQIPYSIVSSPSLILLSPAHAALGPPKEPAGCAHVQRCLTWRATSIVKSSLWINLNRVYQIAIWTRDGVQKHYLKQFIKPKFKIFFTKIQILVTTSTQKFFMDHGLTRKQNETATKPMLQEISADMAMKKFLIGIIFCRFSFI